MLRSSWRGGLKSTVDEPVKISPQTAVAAEQRGAVRVSVCLDRNTLAKSGNKTAAFSIFILQIMPQLVLLFDTLRSLCLFFSFFFKIKICFILGSVCYFILLTLFFFLLCKTRSPESCLKVIGEFRYQHCDLWHFCAKIPQVEHNSRGLWDVVMFTVRAYTLTGSSAPLALRNTGYANSSSLPHTHTHKAVPAVALNGLVFVLF